MLTLSFGKFAVESVSFDQKFVITRSLENMNQLQIGLISTTSELLLPDPRVERDIR
jgi:hypothetical protein